MEFARLQKNWTNLGRNDPLWAILSDPNTRGGSWDMGAFLHTGVEFCNYLSRHFKGLELPLRRGRALDFGCGYGRLTQALGVWFEAAVGVDIAPTMLAGAREVDRSGGRCQFLLNQATDLRQFPDASFDFVLTVLVLQHMRPEYSTGYIREFLRVLRPGGVAFFQVPTEPICLSTDAGVGPRSSANQVLPSDAFRAMLAVHPGAMSLHCAEWCWLRLHLSNQGSHVFRSGDGPGKVQIASRWHNLEGTPGAPAMLTDLPHDLLPGETARMLVPVRAPRDPGQVMLQFLPVQDGVWIESSGVAATRMLVQVAPRDAEILQQSLLKPMPPPPRLPAGIRGNSHDDEAEIEVYAVPVHEVVRQVEAAGGQVVDITGDNWAGPDWLSAHYTVRAR